MIRTFTLNPAVDVTLTVDELVPMHKIRATSSLREAGGGGVNVSRLLVRLGAEVEAVVAAGGATGAEVIEALAALDVVVVELDVDGTTRESIQIHDIAHDLRYRVVVQGPPLVDDLERVAERATSVRVPDVVVFSGSLPVGCPPFAYAELAANNPDTFTIVDTSGAALLGSLSGPVDLIKPSLRELEALTERQIDDAEGLRRAIDELLQVHPALGAVLVSLGAHGAVLGRRNEPPVLLQAPDVPVVSAVGAGDSVVAGVAWGASRGEDLLTACRLGVAAGTATVATPGTALCSATAALNLLAEVQAHELQPHDPIR